MPDSIAPALYKIESIGSSGAGRSFETLRQGVFTPDNPDYVQP
jgi:hypothetical protein